MECTGLQSINILEGVDTIGSMAFRGCTSLTSVTIPKSVVIIWDGAFAGCENLATLMIPESVKFIEEYAFNGTAWYDSQPDGPVYINDILYEYKGKIPPGTRLTVREKTSYISGSAFKDQPGLLSVILPEGIPSINNDLFSGCTGLESVSIPRSVTIIKWNAFKDCTSLSSITIPEKVSLMGGDAFEGCIIRSQSLIITQYIINVNQSIWLGRIPRSKQKCICSYFLHAGWNIH